MYLITLILVILLLCNPTNIGNHMLVQLYNPKDQTYLIADTDNMTNSRWYTSCDEALACITDTTLHIHNSDYSLSDIIRKFPSYTVTEFIPPTQSYEYW